MAASYYDFHVDRVILYTVTVFIHMIRLIVSAINISFAMISHRRQKADKDTRLGHVILSIQICVLVTMINL